MEENNKDTYFDRLFVRNMIESSIRIGLVFTLLIFSYDIIKPFVIPLVWGGIIAIAAFPLTRWLEGKIGDRRGLAATLVSVFFIAMLVIPSFGITQSLLSTAKAVSVKVGEGSLSVPPPSEKIAEIPVIGENVYTVWSNASENLESVLKAAEPQLKTLATKIVKSVGSGLAGVGMFVVSLLIAAGFMAYADSTGRAAHRLLVRIGGEVPGGEWAALVVATVRSVLQGVVGVAFIQATLCAIGLFAMGIPGAPVLSAVILVFGIAQLPALLIILPLIAWTFSAYDTTPAAIFAVWMIFSGISDNFLKPVLMGRGLDIPMPVILVGAIGGMIASGIIGLFAGAVILSIWYKLFAEWLAQDSQ